MNELPALQERMAKLSNDELLAVVTLDFRGYRKEAIALARAELNYRGFSEADIRRPSEDFIEARQPDFFPVRLGEVIFMVVVGFFTFLLFPAAFYYSIVVYGLSASVFMTVGYVIWRLLMRAKPRWAMNFATGFIPPVMLVLVVCFPGLPGLVSGIVAEFLVLCFAIRLLWRG